MYPKFLLFILASLGGVCSDYENDDVSTIVQLYRYDQFYGWKKPEDPEKTADLSQVTDNIMLYIEYTSP